MEDVSIKISGIDCAACVERLDRALGAVRGVKSAAVNYAAGSALISYDERLCGIKDIAACIKRSGYGVPLDTAELKCAGLTDETAKLACESLTGMTASCLARYMCPTGSDRARRSRALKKRGLEVWMLTGDNRRTAESIGRECGIENIMAQVLPQDKAAAVEKLRGQGKTVVMVGDGINDAPALAAADVSIAMGGGTDVAIDSADIVLLSGDIAAVETAFDLSAATMRKIRQNLGWALLYNAAFVPMAACGLINPSMAAAAMSLSSNCVLLNSLGLKKVGSEGAKTLKRQ